MAQEFIYKYRVEIQDMRNELSMVNGEDAIAIDDPDWIHNCASAGELVVVDGVEQPCFI